MEDLGLNAQGNDPNDDPNDDPVRIHFVHFESMGYRGRDARQMEVACLSGGHYQFINSEDMPKGNPRGEQVSFEQALDQALENVRFSLMGYWKMAHDITALRDAGLIANGGTPPGGLYALSGVLTLAEAAGLKDGELVHAYGVGLGSGADDADTWDRRPTVRKPSDLQVSH